MAIQHSGPQGYEHQYRVSAFVTFARMGRALIRADVESTEDLLLTFKDGGKLEVQVKSSDADVHMTDLAEILCHFGGRQAASNLIDRMITDRKLRALIVVGGKCSSDLMSLICKPPTIAKRRVDLTQFFPPLVKLISEAAWLSGKTALKKERRTFCLQLGKTLSSLSSKDRLHLLSRMVIWENIGRDRLVAVGSSVLARRGGVPTELVSTWFEKSESSVKAARDGSDLVASLLQTTSEVRGQWLMDPRTDFEDRSDLTLAGRLQQDHVLLLTGMMFSGKSYIARRMGLEFQRKGIQAFSCASVAEAELLNQRMGTRPYFCLLEDPFGHVELAPHADEEYHRLEKLCGQLRAGYLVVTSRIELVKQIKGSGHLELLGGKHIWTDTTLHDASIASRIWELSCGRGTVTEELATMVGNGLTTLPAGEMLQPGQLSMLAHSSRPIQTFSDALAEGRKTASTWAIMLARSTSMRWLLSVLALACSTDKSVSLLTIAYILARPESDQPGKYENLGFAFGGKSETKGLPQYGQHYDLSDEDSGSLDELQKRGFIRVTGDDQVVFPHPEYREVALLCLMALGQQGTKRVLEHAKFAILCPEPRAAISTVETVHELYRRTNAKEWLTVLQQGLTSIFPSVADRALDVLMQYFGELDKQARLDAQRALQNQGGPIRWEKEIPYLQAGAVPFVDKPSEIDLTLADLANPVRRFTSEVVFAVIERADPQEITGEDGRTMIRLFEIIPERFIRARIIALAATSPLAAQLLPQLCRVCPASLRGRLLDATLRAWSGLANKIRFRIVTSLRRSLVDPIDAIPYSQTLLNFEEKGDEWGLWGAIFPQFLRLYTPILAPVECSNLVHVTFESVRRVSALILERIAVAWIERLEEIESEDSVPPGDALSVILHILALPKGKRRSELFDRVLRVPSTGLRMFTIQNAVAHYSNLSTEEVAALHQAIAAANEHSSWMKAAAITAGRVPPAIAKLTGVSDGSKLSVKTLNDGQLRACLHVFLGEPQPLWWIDTHHRNPAFWDPIVQSIAQDPSDPNFDLAISSVLGDRLNGKGNFETFAELWQKLVRQDRRVVDMLLLLMVSLCCSISTVEAHPLWEMLLDAMPSDQRAEALTYVKKYITPLEISAGRENLAGLLGRHLFFQDILPRFPYDSRAFVWAVNDANQGRGLSEAMEYVAGAPADLCLIESCELLLRSVGATLHGPDAGGLVQALRNRRTELFEVRPSGPIEPVIHPADFMEGQLGFPWLR